MAVEIGASPLSVSGILIRWLGGAGAFAVAMACSTPKPIAVADRSCREELEALSHRTVLFGHQSVGGNILLGLEELAQKEGVALQITPLGDANSLTAGAFSHVLIAENGNPSSKLQSFRRALEASSAPVEVAFMKFCYVDFHRGTDVPALFAEYQATMRDLQKRHPQTTLVHMTAPLTAPEGALKSIVKRVLSRDSSQSLNVHREDFNALVRQAYEGREPLFDLARIESTDLSGHPQTAEWSGRRIPVLAGEYTDDGRHLNRVGQLRVAHDLAVFLAALPSRGPMGTN